MTIILCPVSNWFIWSQQRFLTMKILKFKKRFQDKFSCIQYFREKREKKKVVYKKCENKSHSWLNSKNLFQCKECGFRAFLKSGSVIENSNLLLRQWLLAITFISVTKGYHSSVTPKTTGFFAILECL